jgi:uncharacterized protein (DUF885 family)
MKRFLKWTGTLVGVLVLLAVGLFIQVWYFRPLSINVFFEKVFLQYALADPELLSSVGLLEQFGITGHNRKLTDASPRQTELVARMTREDLEQLHRYDRASLDVSRQLSYDVLDWFLQNSADGEHWQYHDYPVNQFFGVPSDLPRFMVQVHRIDDEDGARDYLTRLSLFGLKFDQVIESLKLRESKGVVPPKFVIARVLEQMREFKGAPAERNSLCTSFSEKVAKLKLSEDRRKALLDQCRSEIEKTVYPAYGRLIAWFEQLQPKVTEDYGVWKLPEGDAYYDYLVRSHTTTDLTAQQVHDFGLAEVARIEAQMDEILEGQGLTEGTIGERIAKLDADPANHYSNDAAGRQQCLSDFQHILDEVTARLEGWFDVKPKQGVKVERMAAFEEKGQAGAYYMSPSLDGKRPGTFYANLRDMHEVQKFGMRTLAYHEGVPGHHLQGAIAAELTGVPTFRKLIPFTAYDEGWGLYAERLAWEMGLEKQPLDNLGRLQAEMFRSVRLVVDTGIHRQHWTREQAIRYMIDKTGMAEGEVVSEIERYFVLPGQALAYKVGMERILEARDRAKTKLGDKFSIGRFHDTVLTQGSLPLAVLDKEVDRWVAKDAPGQKPR